MPKDSARRLGCVDFCFQWVLALSEGAARCVRACWAESFASDKSFAIGIYYGERPE